MQTLEFRIVSSLTKVFLDEAPSASALTGKESVLHGECYAFQIAVRGSGDDGQPAVLTAKATGSGADHMTLRRVRCIPSMLAAYSEHDENYLRGGRPGLYPDLLDEITPEQPLRVANGLWQSVWVEFEPAAQTPAGVYELGVEFYDAQGECCGSAGTSVRLLDAVLDEQKLIFTEWFHCDCIATRYGVEPLSEAHFALLEKYIANAVRNGINMLLTPIFTPPLDTRVGGERPTVQLVGVFRDGKNYRFDFSLLQKYVRLCLKCGVKYFEMSHLFTQWGAQYAPKIMTTTNGTCQRIFGWETNADSPEYRAFLSALLPQLTAELKKLGIAEKTYFHVSDEPGMSALQSYASAAEFLRPYLAGFHTFDALSDYEFYRSGLVSTPVCASNHIKPFLENGVENLWTYYCCGQGDKVSNRFFSMPSARNRIIGAQLYKFGIRGFLHWGYNFWYTQYSSGEIDPFCVTDAGLAFPSGDAFAVYPGKDGPLESIRVRVFAQALCDLRALQTLERLAGRAAVMKLVEEEIEPLTFECYPKEEEYLQKLRMRVNEAIDRLQ